MVLLSLVTDVWAAKVAGRVVDAATGELVPCRLYVEGQEGKFFTVVSSDSSGSAVVYDTKRGASQEVHTTLSAHPFHVELKPGRYQFTAERGKEYEPATVGVVVADGAKEVTLQLRRWVDMAAAGWYSGDTHVHRTLEELPNVILAEDLNVAFPLTYWVTEFNRTPVDGTRGRQGARVTPELLTVDEQHVIWPVNTEYEIFTVGGQRHTLGAVFVLNHREPLRLQAQPAARVAAEARRQGAILEFDKHNWPWSMMLPPVMGVHLYELTNNHLWRTQFLFKDWYPEYFPNYLGGGRTEKGYSEEGWIDWGFANYYALLNCGFEMMPTGGTASGVHPVPLGFGRVYVHVGQQFSFDRWMAGLAAGRSFVTTGPMLDVRVNGQLPGTRFNGADAESVRLSIQGRVDSLDALERVELVMNGEVIESFAGGVLEQSDGRFQFAMTTTASESAWLAVRAFARTEKQRLRFAHSAPFFVDLSGRPLRPRRAELAYLQERVRAEIQRHEGVLPPEALEEYRKALAHYQSLESRAY